MVGLARMLKVPDGKGNHMESPNGNVISTMFSELVLLSQMYANSSLGNASGRDS